MGRREYLIHHVCGLDGCRETGTSVAETRQEEQEARARYAKNPWRCYRHSAPSEVLSVEYPERETTLIAEEVFYDSGYSGKRELLGVRWRWPESSRTSGLVSGPGFRAIADDFPPGTRLIVSVRVEPEQPEDQDGDQR